MNISKTSVAVLVIQLAIISSVAAKYLYQRWTCPRVWTRAVAYDPELLMRGRYFSTRLYVDACDMSLPLKHDRAPNPEDGRVYFAVDGSDDMTGQLPVKIAVKNNKLVAEKLPSPESERSSEDLVLHKGQSCTEAQLWKPVDFYISERAKSPFPLTTGQELWVEVTIPHKGPPRPIALALKSQDGSWHPLTYN